jgi:hypothetical protein
VTFLDPLAALVCLWRTGCVSVDARLHQAPEGCRRVYVDALLSMRSAYRHGDMCLYAGKAPIFLWLFTCIYISQIIAEFDGATMCYRLVDPYLSR